MDEADFKDSDMWQELTKILNNGYRPGMPVLRSERVGDHWQPEGYEVFVPKIIATKARFKDEALESRCLTCEMSTLTRKDIPINLPPGYETEAEDLRVRLLTFRLGNLLALKGRTLGNELAVPDIQPRLNEILMPLRAMVDGDKSMSETLVNFIHQLQIKLFARRQDSPEGRVLASLIALRKEEGELSAYNIAEKVNAEDKDRDNLSPNKVGWILKKLGFEKGESPTTTRKVVVWDEELVKKLSLSYGLTSAKKSSSLDRGLISGKSLEDSQEKATSSESLPDRDAISGAENLEDLEGFSGDMGESKTITPNRYRWRIVGPGTGN